MSEAISYSEMTDEPTVEALAAFLGVPSTDGLASHLATARAYVKTYVRGVGFTDDGHCEADLAAVAAARSHSNPTAVVREEIGSWNVVPAQFVGFTLAEQAVLHTYRRRTA
jgi:hypothetical protein